jgi:uncharacterized RDD family membrane protein YckC
MCPDRRADPLVGSTTRRSTRSAGAAGGEGPSGTSLGLVSTEGRSVSDQPHDDDGTPPAPPAPGSTPWSAPETWGAHTAPSYAGIGKRFLARVLDGLIVGIPLGVLLLVVLGWEADDVAYSILIAIVNVAYFVGLESTQGATLGKRLLGLSVAAESGGNLTPEAAFRRNWWLLLGLLPLIGGLASLGVTIYILVTISSDERNRGWHDKLAGAVVLDR